MQIRLLISDVDGVLTDGGMYYDDAGRELRLFNTADGVGVAFCRLNGIELAFLSGEETPIVRRRAAKLGVAHVLLGVRNKLQAARELADGLGIPMREVAFIGDAVNDLPLLQAVGFAGTVPQAPDYVKRHADYVTRVPGGQGALRDCVEYLLQRRGVLEQTVAAYVAEIGGAEIARAEEGD